MQNKERHFCLISPSQIPTIIYGSEKNSRIEEAAKFLRHILKDITGITIPLLMENDLQHLPEEYSILVGPSKFTKQLDINIDGLENQSIKLSNTGRTLALLGPLPGIAVIKMAKEASYEDRNIMLLDEIADGTFFAVLHFIKEFLNVDFLFPGKLGRVLKTREEIWLPKNIDISFTPKLLFRRIRNNFSGRRRDAEGLKKLDIETQQIRDREPLSRNWFKTQFLGFGADVRFTHNFSDWWSKYGKSHPEWFALRPPVKEKGETEPTRDQSLDDSDRARFCMSNPELIKQIIKEIIEYFKKNQWASTYSISLNDGGVYNTFCICDKCTKMDPVNSTDIKMPYGTIKSLSDRVFSFYSQIAEGVKEQFPNKFLGTYAYSAYRKPPLVIKNIPDNLVIGLVCLNYENETTRQEGRKEIDAWSKICKNFFVRPNALNAFLGFPAFYGRKLAKDVKFSIDRGCIGFDWDCNSGNWSTNGINIWILAQVMWDSSLDVDLLMEKYCKLGFGKSWKFVLDYFYKTERIADDFAKSKKWINWMHSTGDLASIYSKDWLDEADLLLNKAQEAVSDINIKRRIQFLQKGIEMSRIRKKYFLSATEKTNHKNTGQGIEIEHLDGTQVQVFKAGNKKVCKQKEDYYRSIVDSFAFNIGSLNWRNL